MAVDLEEPPVKVDDFLGAPPNVEDFLGPEPKLDLRGYELADVKSAPVTGAGEKDLPKGRTLTQDLSAIAQPANIGVGSVLQSASVIDQPHISTTALKMPEEDLRPEARFASGEGFLTPQQRAQRQLDKEAGARAAAEYAAAQKTGTYRLGQHLVETGKQLDPGAPGLTRDIEEAVGGFLPVIAAGPFGAAEIGLQSFGETLDAQYEKLKAKGMTDDVAAQQAIAAARASGLTQTAIWTVLPRPLKLFIGKVTGEAAEKGIATFLANRARGAAEGAALGAASTAGQNIATGEPVGRGVGPGAAGLAIIQGVMPYAGAHETISEKPTTTEVQDASKISKAAAVHGDVPQQPVESARQVPVEGDQRGILSQAEGRLPETAPAEVSLTPAVRHDGKIYPLEEGQKNHGDIKVGEAKKGNEILAGEHGFLYKGEFIDRAQAAKIFEEQTGKKPATPGELHSQDLEAAGLLKPPEDVHGGAEAELTPEQQAKSRANNSRAAFEASQAKADAEKAAAAKAKSAPQPDWQVNVQAPEGEMPGNIQIVDPRQGEKDQSPTIESLKTAGHDVPDFSKLPQGKYTWAEAVAKLKQISEQPSEPPSGGQAQPAKPVLPSVAPPSETPVRPPRDPKTGSIGKWAYHPDGMDLLDHIFEKGGIKSPAGQKFNNKGEYDGYKEAFGTGMAMRLRRTGDKGQRVDKLMLDLKDKGYNFETADDFYKAVADANTARQGREATAKKEAAQLKQDESQTVAFKDAVGKPGEGKEPGKTAGDTLAVGSTFTVQGEKFTVTEFDPDSETYIVEDGRRFGRQWLHEDETFHPDKGSVTGEQSADFVPEEPKPTTPKLRPGEKGTGDLLQSEQPFNLAGETGTDAERIAAAKAKAAQDAAEAKAKQDKEQQGFEGMGAAAPKEFEQPGSFVSNMFAAIDADRAAQGKPPMELGKRRTWDQDEAMALSKMNKEPDWIPNLIEDVLKNPRPLLSWEQAGMVFQKAKWKAEANNAYTRINRAFEDGDRGAQAQARLEAAGFEDNLQRMEKAVGRGGTGSEAGRSLQAQKMAVGDDLSLVEMRLEARAVKNDGKPLTESQEREVQKAYDELTATKKAADEAAASAKTRESELQAQLAIERLKKDATPVEPHIRIIADKIKAYFDKRAAAALKDLSGKTWTIGPEMLVKFTDLGVSKILSGAAEFTGWSAKMVEALGERVKPHLQQIWDASKAALDAHIEGLYATPANKAKVRKLVKDMDVTERVADVTGKIKEKVAAGEKSGISMLTQRLARYFVEQGVKDRNDLIDKVHAVLKQALPDLTRREAMDAISGYGDFKQLSKDAISRELRDLKGQMQQVAKLEDMQSGTPPSKTGLERRAPSDEERRLIREVNEAKRKFQIPVDDPNTQLKSALDTLKTRLKNRTAELTQKLADGDFAPKERREIKLDKAATAAQAKYQKALEDWKRGLMKSRLAQRSWWEKALDTSVKWTQFNFLSSPLILAKLTAATAARVATWPVESVIGAGLSKLPGIRDVSARAPHEGGGINLRAEVKGWKEGLTTGMKDAYQTVRTGKSDLDRLFGKPDIMPPTWLNFNGRLHAALKAPLRRAAFERSLVRQGENLTRAGADITDPMVETAAKMRAYQEANRASLQQRNFVANRVDRFINSFEEKSKLTGKPTVGGKLAATGMRQLLPIKSVPGNLVAETLMYATGVPTGALRLRSAIKVGVENLKPDEADLIMRELKKGSVGPALLLLGFFAHAAIGGYYQPGKKRDAKDVKPGAIRLPGMAPDVPNVLLHNPALENLQLGAAVGRVADSKLNKKDLEKQGIGSGVLAAMFGLLEETPYVNEMLELSKLREPGQRMKAIDQAVTSRVVPQVIQQIARHYDLDAHGNPIQRDPKTFLQNMEMGIPGLRKNVPKKAKQP